MRINVQTGLLDTDIVGIVNVLQKYKEIQQAYIFGSRAKGNYKQGSDVDIALKGTGITFRIISNVSHELNEDTIMPYKFDVLNYHTIDNTSLIDHIDRVGILIYSTLS